MYRKTEAHAIRAHRICVFAFAAGLFLFVGRGSAVAGSLDFRSTPASEAATRIGEAFHIKLEILGGIDPRRPVTFSVPHIEQDGAVLEAVNSLANAIEANYRKEYVLSAAAVGNPPAAAVIDAATAPVSFDNEMVPAAQAITVVAGVDEASVQIPASIQGTVMFTSKNLTVQEALREIAAQTSTRWNVTYRLTPHSDGGTAPGKVIGYTASGRPIVEMGGVTFRKATAPGEPGGQSPQDLKDPVYISAMMRGDHSAMLKFHHEAPPTSSSSGDSGK